MSHNTMNYNLLVEEWIPVLMTDGQYRRVGITDALRQAGRIREIAASNPMDRVAILRFLLALLYWCNGNPPAESSPAHGDSFPLGWCAKLDDHEHCFNLLGEGKRFCQDPSARRKRPATDLIQEIPTGNNFWHFRHSTDKEDGLCPACCAMGLLRLPLFSVSGRPDLKSGINGKPPVYVLPWGMSLLQTLLANWLPSTLLGEPSWVQPHARLAPGQDVPLLTGLTLLSRRVWLGDPEQCGPCVSCGAAGSPVIRTCMFQSAGEQESADWDDPHVVYYGGEPRKSSRATDLTAAGKFRMDRPWPDLLARVLESGKFQSQKAPVSLLIVGFATDQAKSIDAWERTIALPPGLPNKTEASLCAERIEEWQRAGSSLARRLRPPNEKGSSRKHPEIASTMAAIRPQVEARVSARATELIAGSDDAWGQAEEEYRPMVEVIARSLSSGFSSGAVRRREQIAKELSDSRPRANATGDTAGRKGVDR
jgi:hypothetical protein